MLNAKGHTKTKDLTAVLYPDVQIMTEKEFTGESDDDNYDYDDYDDDVFDF